MTKAIKTQLTQIILSYFSPLKTFVGEPKFSVNMGKVVVQIPYFLPEQEMITKDRWDKHCETLGLALSHLCKGAAVEVRLVQLRYPYLDSCILGQYLAFNAGKYNFLRMKKKLFKKARLTSANDLPYSLTGVKMELAGRLTTQRSIPRKTVLNAHKGSFNVNNEESLNLSHYTSKNKVGAYTMKVWLSQKSNK